MRLFCPFWRRIEALELQGPDGLGSRGLFGRQFGVNVSRFWALEIPGCQKAQGRLVAFGFGWNGYPFSSGIRPFCQFQTETILEGQI